MDKVERSQRFLDLASKHFVALSARVRAPGSNDEKVVAYSCFVLDVDGTWCLITAGHVVDGIKEAIAAGCEFTNWKLEDQTAGKHRFGVPYLFDLEDWGIVLADEEGLDYAASPLRELFRKGLEAGGVKAITEDMWEPVVLDEVKPWLLLGVASESLHKGGPNTAKLTLIPVHPCDPPPHCEPKPNYFYGRLQSDRERGVEDITGMSGGPVFGAKEVELGIFRYWAIGVQSAWFKQSRIICFGPAARIALGLRATLEEVRKAIDDVRE